MNSSSNGFDLRSVVGELREFVSSRNWDSKNAVPAPSESQIELAILSALSQGPKNAQQVIAALAVASAGALKGNSAQVHAALTRLAQAELVAVKAEADRKIYSITNAGQSSLGSAQADSDEQDQEQSGSNSAPSWLKFDPEFLKAASKLAPAIGDLAKTGTRAQQEQATQILKDARHQLHKILAED